MSFIKEYIDLEKEKNAIRHDMKKKRASITREMNTDDFGSQKACIQTMDVLGVDAKFTQLEVARCDSFCENEYCKNKYCHMFRKNNRYINSVNLYKTVSKAQWDLIKGLFVRSK